MSHETTDADQANNLEISTGIDDTDDGVKLGVDGEHFWRTHLTPQGEILTGDGGSLPTPLSGTYPTVYNVAGYGAAGDGTTDDTTAIQDAIDAAEAANGGTVYFPPGVYQTTGIAVTEVGVHLVGSGMGEVNSNPEQGATILRAEAGMVGPLVTINGDFCGVRDMMLDGADIGTACLLIDGASRVVCERLFVRDAGTDGIIVGDTAGSHVNKFDNIYIISCASRGMCFRLNAYDTQVSNIWIGQCGGSGVRADSGAQFFTNLHVWGCTSHGVEVRSNANRFANVYMETNGGSGFDFFNAKYNTVVGGVLRANGSRGAVINGTSHRNVLADLLVYNNGTEGIYIVTGDMNQIVGCNCFDDQGTKTQDYGVRIAAGISNVVANIVARAADHTTAGISDAGTTSVLTGNVG